MKRILKLGKKEIVVLLLYSVTNSVMSLAILYMINKGLSGDESFTKPYMAFVFVAFVLYTYFLNIIFQKHLNTFSFTWLYNFEKRVFAQFLKAPLEKLEKFGPQRFFTTVEDLRIFSSFPNAVTHTVNSVLMLILCVLYMFYISVVAALIVVILIVAVAGCYLLVMRSMSTKVESIRVANEEYFGFVDDVVNGFKELKLSFLKRKNLMNSFLIPNRNKAQKLDTNINYVFLSINLISQYGLYFVVGIVLFILPAVGLLPHEGVVAYVIVILFMSGPINILINFQQLYTRLFVANARIKNFLEDFEVKDNNKTKSVKHTIQLDSLEFTNLCFKYSEENVHEKSFALGPLDLEIKQGETVFIVGGNGSGKSTFINLLTGLYLPTVGKIKLNGKELTNNTEYLQNMIAAVFTDNHLFSQNYESYQLDYNTKYKQLIDTMKLNEVLEKNTFKLGRRKFSKGQSKRLSLIFALLEEKPILVLDEWAADQDPHFRKFFYEELLPQIKKEGKTIIAVSHDDRYFKYADRLIKLDIGKVVKNIRPEQLETSGESFWV